MSIEPDDSEFTAATLEQDLFASDWPLDANDGGDPALSDAGNPDADEEYAPPARRSRVTTGLVVALVFVVGVLVGVALTRALTPAPEPTIVYRLDQSADGPSAGQHRVQNAEIASAAGRRQSEEAAIFTV